MSSVEIQRKQQFKATLFQYLLIFSISGIIIGSGLHIYMTKKVIAPVRKMIQSMKTFDMGKYPEPVNAKATNELGTLVNQYNELIAQLKTNDSERKKLVADLSHELRTPLANLKGYLHGLKTGVIPGDNQLYESLYAEAERLTKMVEQIDQLKSPDHEYEMIRMNKQYINMKDEVNKCLSMFAWILRENNITVK